MSQGSKNGIYLFDQFKLDAEKLMLYRDEVEIPLPPKVVKTLSVLVESGNQIVSKNDLMDRVWSDSVVEEANLSQHLYLLRKTLGTRSNGRAYIETLRRRGYRFTADVLSLENGHGSPAISRETEARVQSPGVERDGNVLRLVDWRPATEPQSIPSPPSAPTTKKLVLSKTVIAVVLAIALAPLIVAAFVFFRPGSTPRGAVASKSELSITRLTNGGFPADAALSPDGDFFVYHETDGEVWRMYTQQVGQSSRVEIASSTTHQFQAKTFSPDGKFVYYSAGEKRGGQVSELYRLPVMGGPQTRLLSRLDGPVSFSPNGSEIVFLRLENETGVSRLVIADKDGLNERILREVSSPVQIVGPPSWSPDGSLVAYAEADITASTLAGTTAIFAVDVTDGSIRKLSEERWDTVYRIAWTHQGDGVAMIATRENEGLSTRRDQVYFVSYPAGESRRLTNDGNRHQTYSLGVTPDNRILAVPFSRSSQIWSVDLTDNGRQEAHQISTGSTDGRAGLAPLPDGRVGYITRLGELVSTWIMNADGTDARQLTNEPPVLEELRADPQGRYFVFSAPVGKRSQLFRIDVDGSNLRQLTDVDGNAGDSSVSPDGNWVVYSSGVLRDRFRTELWKVSIDGNESVLFSDEQCSSPHYSPDGSLVSCVKDEMEILVLSATDGKRLEGYRLPPSSIVNFGVGWTPDGSGLTFIRWLNGYSNIWMVPRKPEPVPKQLTEFTSGGVTRFAYSTDGLRLFVARGYPISDAILISNFR